MTLTQQLGVNTDGLSLLLEVPAQQGVVGFWRNAEGKVVLLPVCQDEAFRYIKYELDWPMVRKFPALDSLEAKRSDTLYFDRQGNQKCWLDSLTGQVYGAEAEVRIRFRHIVTSKYSRSVCDYHFLLEVATSSFRQVSAVLQRYLESLADTTS